jgi:hypothetical protein
LWGVPPPDGAKWQNIVTAQYFRTFLKSVFALTRRFEADSE